MPKGKAIKRREEPGTQLEKWKLWAKSEYMNEGKFWSNMALLRSVGLFVGSVVVIRSFGDIIGVE